MLRENWFATPIWSIQTDIDTKPIAEKCLQMRANGHTNRVRSNYGGWQSTDLFLKDHEEFLSLRETLLHHINLLAKDISSDFDLRLDNVWVNINDPGTNNIEHIHPWSTFSGTFYVQTDDNTGDIRFTDKWSPAYHYGFDPKNSDVFYQYVTYKPKDGMLLFFPSWLNHYVLTNQSSLTRISISFNIKQFVGD